MNPKKMGKAFLDFQGVPSSKDPVGFSGLNPAEYEGRSSRGSPKVPFLKEKE